MSASSKMPSARCTGVDTTQAMLVVARRRLPNLSLVQASATAMPLATAAFDRVVSTSALHYVDEPAAMLAEVRRVLVPGGVVVISDWCADFWTMRLFDLALRTVWRSLDPAHARVLRGDELARLLREAGFHDVTVTREKIDRFWGIMTVRAT
jgi:ubiquinone/menaquinone biosynthesis C-methylase UbiE